ncbi:MAG TPA: winged helix-turn-helix domain-containing protein [Candidatus Sulfotelmatobacter sp.]|nr:winged helix-turn-helix domain-containing protein [Candidatus Sulfotelmatobacter sp.]
MTKTTKQLYEFGPFRVDTRECLLLREGKVLALTPKAFETLLVLLQNAGRLLPKDELMQRIWQDSYVEEVNLSQHISTLRKALGDTAHGSRYIVTVPGRGYRFTEKVRFVPERDEIELVTRSITKVQIEEEISGDIPETVITAKPATYRSRRRLFLCTATLILVAALAAFRPTIPPPGVIRVRQVTRIGTLVYNTYLLTDGPRIYFTMWDGNDRAIRYVSPDGGELFPVQKPFPDIDLYDISAGGSEFLLVNLGDSSRASNCPVPYVRLWREPAPSGSPQPVGDVCTHVARWSPNGRTVAYGFGSDLYLANRDGRDPRKLASLPGEVLHLVWSPDGDRLRFSVANADGNGITLWQAKLSANEVQRFLPELPSSARPWVGGWTSDGKYFFFSAIGDGTTRNIWAIRENDRMLRRANPQPMQITAGPLAFYVPTPSKDGKSVFAVGEQKRGQLVRYDRARRQFVPYAQGISADQAAFSNDGQWMAYVRFPEGVLVQSRVDGSDQRQVTFPPMRVFSPQWSPDGTQIAFYASAQPGAPNKIYVVPSSGGTPVLAAPDSRDIQTCPSWASDGGSILFSSSDERGANPVFQTLDLTSKKVSLVPGSQGLYAGQLSPDGRHVIALEDNTQRLILYDVASHKTRAVAALADYPRWSADGRYVYFSTLYLAVGGKSRGVYRWKMESDATEMVTAYPDFLLAGVWGVCYSLTPDGDTVFLRDLSTRDLYALDMVLP